MAGNFKIISSNSPMRLANHQAPQAAQPPPPRPTSSTPVVSQTASPEATGAEADLANLMAGLSKADMDMLTKMLCPKKVKSEKEVEYVEPLPPMFMVECTYTCELCSSKHSKKYKCNKEEAPINNLTLFWCESCEIELLTSPHITREELTRRLLYFAKKLYPDNIKR